MKLWCYFMAAFAVAGLSAGCHQRAPEPQPTQQAAAPAPVAPLPIVEQPLDREAMIIAVVHAASQASLGKTDEPAQRTLDGKRFSLRLRFGCEGASANTDSRGWAFDEKRRVLSIKVEPGITTEVASVRAKGGEDVEAVEGFWIRHPWMLAAGCPRATTRAHELPMQPKTSSISAPATDQEGQPADSLQIGLAQFFTETDARTHRRDKRAYTATKVLAEGVRPSKEGYDLVITGRLQRLKTGAVVTCTDRGSALPPDCVISAEFDTVAIEDPITGETIATWSSA